MLKGQRRLLKSWVTMIAKQQMVRPHSKDSADAVSTEHWKYTKLPNFFRNFLQITSVVPVKQACFIVPHWLVP
jgi:hypothetical protein